MISVAVVAAAGAFLGAGPIPGPAARSGIEGPLSGITLTGHWRLDRDRSDDPDDKKREVMEAIRDDRSRPVTMDPRMPPYGGVPGRYPGGPRGMDDPRAAAVSALDPPKELTIAQRTTLVLIQEGDDEGSVRGVHTDGHRRTMPAYRGEIEGRWESGRLVVETWRADGLHTIETFEVGNDPREMKVTLSVVVEGMEPISLTSLYVPDHSKRD